MSFGEEVLPRALGPYELLARIGRGGMGDVYWARHGVLSGFEKHCVLKMLRDDRASDPELLARFADEARVVVQLTHRNICPVFDVGRVGDRLYVVLEHIVGRDLRTVALLQPLPLPIALHIVGEVCEALDYAHRFVDRKTGAPLGLVHRDVSPHNVLLGVDGDTKLIDFGIATTAVTAAPSQEVLGKLAYMSPEHARGEVVDHRSDQFATAVMLTELVLGERFHGELSTAEIHAVVGTGTWRPPRFASIDAGLRAILERALAPRAADRWSSMGDFADALSAWATKQGAIATPRDVRRHLLAVCGDLAAEHRAALAHIDAAPPVADAAVVDAPAAVDDDGQFESIATTLALPGPTPAFGSIPNTTVLDRAAVRAATSKKRSSLGLVAAAAALGVAVGALGVVVAWPRPTAELIAVAQAPEPLEPPPEPSPSEPSPSEPWPPEPSPPEPSPPEPEPSPDSSKPSKPSKPPKSTKPSTTRRASFDAETTRALTTLRGCVDKVPCAQGVIEWSAGPVSSATALAELKDAATACAKRCRLK